MLRGWQAVWGARCWWTHWLSNFHTSRWCDHILCPDHLWFQLFSRAKTLHKKIVFSPWHLNHWTKWQTHIHIEESSGKRNNEINLKEVKIDYQQKHRI
jgi:hypothetical protein